MKRISTGIVIASLAAIGVACGPQAGEEYLGEPLLSMRGRVTTSGLTTAQPILPALCFIKPAQGGVLDYSKLPAVVQPTFAGSQSGRSDYLAYILDVEVEGAFPAEFNVNVYAPPPAAALAPLLPGEPASAMGAVCAVQAGHGDVSESVTALGGSSCGGGDEPCRFSNVILTDSLSRHYFEHAECPDGTPTAEECTITRGGDVALLTETGGFEHVVGTAWDPELVYLAEPAPAGSYTAYKLGAVDGLPAGYHLRTRDLGPPDKEGQQQYSDATIAVWQAALAETNAVHGTSYTSLPDYHDETGLKFAPDEVAQTFARVQARLEMEMLPLPMRSSVAPDGPGLTLDLEENSDWLSRLPPLLAPRRLPFSQP
jgi:hypothetical protein